MANKTIVQLTSKPTLTTADLIPVGDASTAILYKRTLGDLITGLGLATGSGTANYLTKWTSANALGASGVFESGGSLGIGTTSLTGYSLRISKNIVGSTSSYAIRQDGQVQSSVTSIAYGFANNIATQATTFTLNQYVHFIAGLGSIGAGSVVTSQYGFFAGSNLTSATNNYGFYGDIPSGSGRWNLYMSGTANNYLAGSLGIGATSLTGRRLVISGNLTGATTSISISNSATIQSDVTSARYYQSSLFTQATTFTLSTAYHFVALQNTLGSGSVIANQYGFFVDSTLIGATNNYGFYGDIASATGRWNLYMNGTAQNHIQGNLLIGTTSGVTGGGKVQVNGDVNINGLFKINGVAISSGGGGTGTITGSGTTDFVPKWTSSSALGNSPISISGTNTNILVGTTGNNAFLTMTSIAPFGFSWGVIRSNDGVGGAKTIVYDASDHNWYIAGTARMYLSGAGDLYINQPTTSGTYKLDVGGAIRSTVDVIITSDKRVKENIVNVTDALSKVDAMQGVYYTRKDIAQSKQYIGFLAQDIEGTLPQVVNKDSLGNYGVSYGNITALHNEAIKELNKKISHLESIINGSSK
jgi:hypothetical protein